MFAELDETISEQEIVDAIKKLNSGKSGGPDRLLNKFFIFTELTYCLSIYQSYLTLFMIAATFLHVGQMAI